MEVKFFLCSLVPNDPWTGTCPRPRGWGPLDKRMDVQLVDGWINDG